MIRNEAIAEAEDYLRADRVERALRYAQLALVYGKPDAQQEGRATLVKAIALQRLGNEREAAELYRSLVVAHASSSAGYEAKARLAELRESASREGRPLQELPHQRDWMRKPVEIPYPAQARTERKEGYAVLELIADATGVLRSYRVLEASDPVFEEAALAIAPQFELDPTKFKQKDRLVKQIRLQWKLERNTPPEE